MIRWQVLRPLLEAKQFRVIEAGTAERGISGRSRNDYVTKPFRACEFGARPLESTLVTTFSLSRQTD